jgi:hypothetical protein
VSLFLLEEGKGAKGWVYLLGTLSSGTPVPFPFFSSSFFIFLHLKIAIAYRTFFLSLIFSLISSLRRKRFLSLSVLFSEHSRYAYLMTPSPCHPFHHQSCACVSFSKPVSLKACYRRYRHLQREEEEEEEEEGDEGEKKDENYPGEQQKPRNSNSNSNSSSTCHCCEREPAWVISVDSCRWLCCFAVTPVPAPFPPLLSLPLQVQLLRRGHGWRPDLRGERSWGKRRQPW